MRTVLWFIYFWIYLLAIWPALFAVRKLEKNGNTKEHDAKVRIHVGNWAKRLLKLAGAKITVTGLENIPDEPVVFVSNHQGYFDVPLMISQLDEPHPLVAKIEIKKIPLIRSWMSELRCIFIDRKDARQSMDCLKMAQELLQAGYSVIIFPEGTRNRGGELGEFKAGGIRIATKAKVPIVPVCIDGSCRLMENNKMWIHPAEVRMRILPPINTSTLTHDEIRALPNEIQNMVKDGLNQIANIKNS